MASEFDELIERVQYSLALSGDEGLSFKQVEQAVKQFFEDKDATKSHDDISDGATEALLFSESPPSANVKVDKQFVEPIWTWLSKQDDVKTKHVSTNHDQDTQQNEETVQSSVGSASSGHASERLFTTKERFWRAITGHSIDKSTIKPSELVLLQIIARQGPAGLTQPELVKLSGQDKRSVPKRTDALASAGYITKTAVIAHAAKTSFLKLKRFENHESDVFKDERVAFYDRWFDIMMQLFHSHDGVLALNDLRAELGIKSKHWQVKALARCLNRLCENKCLQRVKAHVEGKAPGEIGSIRQSIQLLRAPTEVDRRLFMQRPETALKTETVPSRNVSKNAQDDEDDDEVDDNMQEHKLASTGSVAAQWTPAMPISNFIFDLIEHSASDSMSVMEIHRQGLGSTWRRPMDEVLLRMSEHGQPAHLRHLAVGKTPTNSARVPYNTYRILSHTEEVAKDHTTQDDQAARQPDSLEISAGEHLTAEPDIDLGVDQWGFPSLSKALFAGSTNGAATLDECYRGIARSASSQPAPTKPPKAKKRKLEDTKPSKQRSPKKQRLHEARLKVWRAAANASSALVGDESVIDSPHAGVDAGKSAPQVSRVTINPPGARELKIASKSKHGRPRKCLIAVFSSPALRKLDWFIAETDPTRLQRDLALLSNKEVRAESRKRKRDDKPKTPTPTTAPITTHVQKQSEVIQRQTHLQAIDHAPTMEADGASEESSTSNATPLIQTKSMIKQLRTSSVLSTPKPLFSKPVESPIVEELATKKQATPTAISDEAVKVTRTKFNRAGVIMDIIRRSGGVFPGNKELIEPALAALRPVRGDQADVKAVEAAIKDLITKGKLRRMVFQVHDAAGLPQERSVLAIPTISPADPRVRDLQMKIRQHYPDPYVPDHHDSSLATPPDSANVESRSPAHESLQSTVQTPPPLEKSSGPTMPSIVVKRTAAGLLNEHDRREALLAKNAAAGPVKRRRPTNTNTATLSDEEDLGEPYPEQLLLMTEIQIDNYEHDQSHAFPPPRPMRLRFPRSENFRMLDSGHTLGTIVLDSRAKMQSLLQSDVNSSVQLLRNAAANQMKATTDRPGQTSFASRMIPPWQSKHGALAPVSEVGQQYFPMLQQMQQRGQGQSAQVSATISSNATDSTAVGAVAASGQTVHASDERADQASDPQKKMRPRKAGRPAYKSMRGNRHALGLEQATHEIPSVHILFEDEAARGPAYVVTKKRDRRGPQMFDEMERLVKCVALYRAVMGGLDQRNNWGVIAHMLSFRFEADFLRRRWDVTKNAQESTVLGIIDQIYEAFPIAYEHGSVPAVNFEDPGKTDWPALLQWAESLTSESAVDSKKAGFRIPSNRNHFQRSFNVTESTAFWEHSKEGWFTTPVEKTRLDLAHEFVYGTPLAGHQRPGVAVNPDTIVLRSIIRAIATTLPASYNPSQAAAKLSTFDKKTISAVKDEMVGDRTLRHLNKGRQMPGRNFEIHDSAWAFFRRWPGKTDEWRYLRDLAAARARILKHLDMQGAWTLSFHCLDSEVIVLMNMLSQGMVEVITELPERNDDFEAPFPKLSALGYNGYTYNAKTLDKGKLRFPVKFQKTEQLTSSHGLVENVPIPMGPVEGSAVDDGRIPFWVDIHSNLLPNLWDLVVRDVLHFVLFRFACTAKHIEASHNHKLLSWEINLILNWMEESGIACRHGPGREIDGDWTGGWSATAWWYCAFVPEMTPWRVVSIE